MNFLDKLSLAFSPSWFARRERARTLAASWRAARAHYEGASIGRRTAGWHVVSTDADASALGARSRLRDAAHDMVRNDALAARAVTVISQNVVGPGIIPTIQVSEDLGKEAADELRARLEKLLKKYVDTPLCDSMQRQDLYGLQSLVMRTVVESGECLVRRRPRFARDNLPVPFQLQVLEPDYIDGTASRPSVTSNYIVEGVEFTPYGRIAGYWLFDQHPGSMRQSLRMGSKFVPAADVMHIFMTMRPGQVRGVSFFAPVLLPMKDLSDFKDAHLMRQKIAACFAAFIQTTQGFQTNPDDGESPETGYPVESFEPGMIERLRPDEEVTFGQPPQVQDFDPYIKSRERNVAAGLSVSYEALTGDLSGVNFSSGRMGWLEFQRSIDGWRNYMFMPQFCWVFGRWFLDGASIVTGLKLDELASVVWTAPRREMISPDREVPAIKNAIRAGLTSRSEEQRKLGFDPSDLEKEIAGDNERADELGLIFDSDPRRTGAAGSQVDHTPASPDDEQGPRD